METTNRKNVWILAATMVIFMLGYGMVQLIFPFLVQKFGQAAKIWDG